MSRAFWLGVAAYVVPSFVNDVIVPFGLLSMLIQGAAFSWVYPRVFAGRRSVLWSGLAYGLLTGLLSWSFTTLAVGAKNVMTSAPTYLALETGFTLLQFVIVGPLIALAHRR